jgi:hypothetical protein
MSHFRRLAAILAADVAGVFAADGDGLHHERGR